MMQIAFVDHFFLLIFLNSVWVPLLLQNAYLRLPKSAQYQMEILSNGSHYHNSVYFILFQLGWCAPHFFLSRCKKKKRAHTLWTPKNYTVGYLATLIINMLQKCTRQKYNELHLKSNAFIFFIAFFEGRFFIKRNAYYSNNKYFIYYSGIFSTFILLCGFFFFWSVALVISRFVFFFFIWNRLANAQKYDKKSA